MNRSRGHLLRLLRRPRKGDPRRCSSVDILAREIPGGFLRCSSVGRCSSVDILAREIPRLAVQILLANCLFLVGAWSLPPVVQKPPQPPSPPFSDPSHSLAADYLCPIGSLSLSLSLSSGLLPSHQSSLSFFTGSHPLPLLSRHCYCVNWVAVTAPPIPTVPTLRNPGHRDCRLRLFAVPLVSLLSYVCIGPANKEVNKKKKLDKKIEWKPLFKNNNKLKSTKELNRKKSNFNKSMFLPHLQDKMHQKK
ncbi:hypothetical protein Taro_045479 [Colocasia esculenta]|uniref:Uncharacterized protein n=1 Tax=Colocasia esculenta TaxID=4460 RepID=A0A843WRE8_COLES|nr:hypothetical protein [Colocasia esculenta]